MAEQVEGGLDRDRIRLHAEQLDRGAQLVVERAGAVEVAGPEPRDHLLDLKTDDMRRDADRSHAAELDEGKDEIVVTRVQIQPLGDDVTGRLE